MWWNHPWFFQKWWKRRRMVLKKTNKLDLRTLQVSGCFKICHMVYNCIWIWLDMDSIFGQYIFDDHRDQIKDISIFVWERIILFLCFWILSKKGTWFSDGFPMDFPETWHRVRTVRVVGDHPSLGNWDPEKGLELETQQDAVKETQRGWENPWEIPKIHGKCCRNEG
jgi:hypothetical protein